MDKLTKENAKLNKKLECMNGIIKEYRKLDKLNTQALEENKVKVEKWDKLIKAIQDSYDEDGDRDVDFDIWEFLEDKLGVGTDGEESKSKPCPDSDDESD